MSDQLTEVELQGLDTLLKTVGKVPELLQALAMTTKFITTITPNPNSELVDRLIANLVLMRETAKLLRETENVFTATAAAKDALLKAAGPSQSL